MNHCNDCGGEQGIHSPWCSTRTHLTVPLTKDFAATSDSIIGSITISRKFVKEVTDKFEKNLISIAPSLVYDKGEFKIIEFSVVVKR